VAARQQVLLTGPTGVGKTYLACALAAAAIRAGHTALYARTPRLLAEIGTARADGRLARLLVAWARIEVLVLDDFALQPLTDAQAADLLEVIEDRAGLRSTIVTSQLPVALWHESLGEPTVADAICDRLLASAHRIELSGASLRRSEPRTASRAMTADARFGDAPMIIPGCQRGSRSVSHYPATSPVMDREEVRIRDDSDAPRRPLTRPPRGWPKPRSRVAISRGLAWPFQRNAHSRRSKGAAGAPSCSRGSRSPSGGTTDPIGAAAQDGQLWVFR
jgi:IstB-like ATP binding protein